MREICSYPTKYLHTCPTELLKKAEEKGITIGTLDNFSSHAFDQTATNVIEITPVVETSSNGEVEESEN